jgi:hypothetical protein
MDTSEAEFNYVRAKPKRKPPDLSRLLEEITVRDFNVSGNASATIGARVGYSAVQSIKAARQKSVSPAINDRPMNS